MQDANESADFNYRDPPPPADNCNRGKRRSVDAPMSAPKRRRNEVDLTQDTDGARPTRSSNKWPVDYSETRRRVARQCTKRVGYMDRGQQGNSQRTKRGHAATVVGTAVVERVVQGRYAWRDGM